MDYVKKLFKIRNPYAGESVDELFVKAMKQSCVFQYENNSEYKRILDEFHFSPECISSFDDLIRLPPIPTLYFKHNRLIANGKTKSLITTTSSGTSGKSQSSIGYDLYTLLRGFDEVRKLFSYHKVCSIKPTRFVVFGYEHRFRNTKAIAKTSWGFTFTAPALSKDYAIRYKNGEYKVDLENIEKKLIKYAKGHHQVRTLGFPAYTYFLLKQMDDRGINVKLPRGSMLTLGGGWKQFYTEACSKEEFYALAKKVLGLESDRIIEFFGAVEHPIMWTQCRNHRFHVPNYARVIIRDVDTLAPVKNGEVGIINLLTPISRSAPLLSVMTDDIGILHDNDCDCGIDSPYLEILGRVGLSDIKTCAAGAEDLLKEVSQ